MHTNVKQDAHQRYDTFGEGRIRINTVLSVTHTHTSLLFRAMNSTNEIARYTNGSLQRQCSDVS
jgi:hypothetical protein